MDDTKSELIRSDDSNVTSASGTAIPAATTRSIFTWRTCISLYATILTVLFAILAFSGRIILFGTHPLESLPDIRPLDAGEFQVIPEDTQLPDGHALGLGESRRLGDVIVTALKVTREPLRFVGFQNGREAPDKTTEPVLKLWLTFQNVSNDYRFPPYDASLHSWRSPPDGTDTSVRANSFLTVHTDDALQRNDGQVETSNAASDGPDMNGLRVLNFLQSADSNFVIVDQNAGAVISPDETLTTFVASDESIMNVFPDTRNRYEWRVHFRKGVHRTSGHGVTTLVDVKFTESDIER